ncbi:MAG: hypothetical protein ACJ73S_31000 [Mycobacteriales bacterium]
MTTNWRRAAAGLVFAVATIGGTALPAAASAAPAHLPVSRAALFTDEFDGFGIGRAPAIALRNARTSARSQASAAGYNPETQCVTGFEDTTPDGAGLFIGESDLFCTR